MIIMLEYGFFADHEIAKWYMIQCKSLNSPEKSLLVSLFIVAPFFVFISFPVFAKLLKCVRCVTSNLE